MSQVQPQFDPNDPKYRCCCGCHVMTGAKILASLYTIYVIIEAMIFIAALSGPSRSRIDSNMLCFILGYFLVEIAVLGSLLYGLSKEREGFLIPMLICMVTIIILAGVYIVFLFLSYLNEIVLKRRASAEAHTLVFIFFFICACWFALQCWFFKIYKNAYDYIVLKRLSLIGGLIYIQQSDRVYVAVRKENPEP
uniref:DUF7027 domain-containing protein n=1 Tax=Plectus sambesii TaxID=2011161 RepID=A0A914WNL8_9BILA